MIFSDTTCEDSKYGILYGDVQSTNARVKSAVSERSCKEACFYDTDKLCNFYTWAAKEEKCYLFENRVITENSHGYFSGEKLCTSMYN